MKYLISIFGTVLFSLGFPAAIGLFPEPVGERNQAQIYTEGKHVQSRSRPEKNPSTKRNKKKTMSGKNLTGMTCNTKGCSIGKHRVNALSRDQFHSLLKKYHRSESYSSGSALDYLLYYGEQTRSFLREYGAKPLSSKRLQFLKEELSRTEADVSVRMIDREGNETFWIQKRTVPLVKKQHLYLNAVDAFEQTLDFNGTVYRVSKNRLWARY